MTTPTPPAALTVSADKDTYNVGDAIIVTVDAGDSTVQVEMTITANATDTTGNALTGTTTVAVNQSAAAVLNGFAVTDSFGDAYTPQGPTDGVSQAVFAGVVGPVPAA